MDEAGPDTETEVFKKRLFGYEDIDESCGEPY